MNTYNIVGRYKSIHQNRKLNELTSLLCIFFLYSLFSNETTFVLIRREEVNGIKDGEKNNSPSQR
jgi:hypothetical protein